MTTAAIVAAIAVYTAAAVYAASRINSLVKQLRRKATRTFGIQSETTFVCARRCREWRQLGSTRRASMSRRPMALSTLS